MGLTHKSYPKIPAFGYDGTEDILDGYVTITPKIDGSNVQIWLGDGVYHCGRRNDWLSESDKGFAPFLDFARKRWESSTFLKSAADRDNWLVIFGEFSNNQNKLKYNLKSPIIVFDVAETSVDDDGAMHFDFYDYEAMKAVADQADLDYTFAAYQGEGSALGDVQNIIDTYLNQPSILGGVMEEGVVVKSYGRKTRYGRPYFAKLVTAEYSERNATKTKPTRLSTGIGEWAVAEFFNKARLLKAVQKIKEDGTWVEESTKKNIGKLIGVVTKDIHDEHYEEIAAKAAQVAWKEVNVMVAKQIAPTLDQLVKDQNVSS